MSPDDIFLTPAEVAQRHRTDVATLANKRSAGTGLPFVKIDGRVLYRCADVLAAEDAGYAGVTAAAVTAAAVRCPGVSKATATAVADHIAKTLHLA